MKHIIYRIRQPLRRRQHWRGIRKVTAPFGKNAAARPTTGPAVVFGEFSRTHGLGRAAAYDISLLRARHSKLDLVDLANIDCANVLDIAGVENIYFFTLPDTYDRIFRVLRPEQVARTWRVGRWVWETPLFPDEWQFAEPLLHEIWTPSEFCSSVFREKLAIPVKTIAHAVAVPAVTDINIREHLGVPHDAFLGLAIMDLRSCPQRKNPWAHIAAWKEWFGADQRAILVMKVRTTKRTAVVIDELQDLIGGVRNIILLTNELSNDEISALHRSADVYLSLHRSEGFGLTIYEALLLGKPVVATDWSAPAEYGPRFQNYIPVPFRLVPYSDWTGFYGNKHFLWAEPIPSEIPKELLRKSSRD